MMLKKHMFSSDPEMQQIAYNILNHGKSLTEVTGGQSALAIHLL